MSRFFVAILLLILSTQASVADLRITEPVQGKQLAAGRLYEITFKCWVRQAGNPPISFELMKRYMSGLGKDGVYDPSARHASTRVFHSVVLSKSAPTVSTPSSTVAFATPNAALQIPVFFATAKRKNITNLIDGTRLCPQRVLSMGTNDLYLSSIFYRSDETDETSILADLAEFVTDAWPELHFVVFNNEAGTDQEKKFETVKPLATAVEKIVNGWRGETEITRPARLQEGVTVISTAMTTVEITVTPVSSFLEHNPERKADMARLIPSSAPKFDYTTPAKLRASCIAHSNALEDLGLSSAVDRSYLLHRAMRRAGQSKENIVRCLVVGEHTDAAIGASAALFEEDAKLRLTANDIDVFARNYPEDLADGEIEDKAASKAAFAARLEATDQLITLLLHRARREARFEDIAGDIQNLFRRHVGPSLAFMDHTTDASFEETYVAKGAPFDVLKSITASGVERFACLKSKPATGSASFGKYEFFFVGYQQPIKDRRTEKLDAAKAYVFWPEFDAQNRLVALTATDDDLDTVLTLAGGKCAPPKA
jgi:hypothetical protein